MSEDKKWDIKQLGVGGGSVIGILFLFQSQGIDLMNKQQEAQNGVVIEKTIANAARITKLEETVTNLNDKIDRGFDSVRVQIRDETSKLSDIVRISSSDRYTKTEHDSYKDSVDNRIRRLEDDLKELRSQKTK